MGYYQGRALEAHRRVRRASPWRGMLRVGAVIVVLVALAHVPWQTLRRRVAIVTEVRVEGARYLDAHRIAAIAKVQEGDDLLALDLARARQALLMNSRIRAATVARRFPRGVTLQVEERVPVLLVQHGVPWEIDSAGVLMAPLQAGVVADVPLLVGPSFEGVPPGAHVDGPALRRGLAWAVVLARQELQLAGRVSEIDVAAEQATALTLLTGTRVVAPAWPPSVRRLSALRVVLADLEQKGTAAEEVDLRFEHQVIVRPAPPAGTVDATHG